MATMPIGCLPVISISGLLIARSSLECLQSESGSVLLHAQDQVLVGKQVLLLQKAS